MSRDITTLSVLELISMKHEFIQSLPLLTCEDMGKPETDKQREVREAAEWIDNRLIELIKENKETIKKHYKPKKWERDLGFNMIEVIRQSAKDFGCSYIESIDKNGDGYIEIKLSNLKFPDRDLTEEDCKFLRFIADSLDFIREIQSEITN